MPSRNQSHNSLNNAKGQALQQTHLADAGRDGKQCCLRSEEGATAQHPIPALNFQPLHYPASVLLFVGLFFPIYFFSKLSLETPLEF